MAYAHVWKQGNLARLVRFCIVVSQPATVETLVNLTRWMLHKCASIHAVVVLQMISYPNELFA